MSYDFYEASHRATSDPRIVRQQREHHVRKLRIAPPPTGRDDMSWPDPGWMYALAGVVVVLACVWVL